MNLKSAIPLLAVLLVACASGPRRPAAPIPESCATLSPIGVRTRPDRNGIYWDNQWRCLSWWPTRKSIQVRRGTKAKAIVVLDEGG